MAPTIIIMGVCGCGKTSVGRIIAGQLHGVFEDADDFHTDAAKDKMRASMPLTDEDRWPWFERLRARILELRGKTPVHVLACSALKAVYRDRLRGDDTPELITFVLLDGSFELIHSRMKLRKGHYMPVSLLESQFAILEKTEDLVSVSIEGSPEEIAAEVMKALA